MQLGLPFAYVIDAGEEDSIQVIHLAGFFWKENSTSEAWFKQDDKNTEREKESIICQHSATLFIDVSNQET